MSIDNKKYKVVISFSYINKTLDIAKKLALLSGEMEEEEHYLAGCSIIMQAAVLDQGTESIITNLAMNYAVDNEIEVSKVPFLRNVYESLRKRVFYLPRLLSIDEYILDKYSKVAKDIESMISLRNEIIHIRDYHKIMSFENQANIYQMEIDDDHLVVKFPLLESIWEKMNAKLSLEFFDSTREYYQYVMWPNEQQEEREHMLIKTGQSSKTYRELLSIVSTVRADVKVLGEIHSNRLSG